MSLRENSCINPELSSCKSRITPRMNLSFSTSNNISTQTSNDNIPFYPTPQWSGFSSYSICTRVYLDSRSQEYITILTIDRMPVEATSFCEIIKPIQLPVLSPFQRSHDNRGLGTYGSCGTYAIMSLRPEYQRSSFSRIGSPNFMDPSEIPSLFSFLSQLGYRVDTQVTQMLNSGPIAGLIGGPSFGSSGPGDLVCYISYNSSGIYPVQN